MNNCYLVLKRAILSIYWYFTEVNNLDILTLY